MDPIKSEAQITSEEAAKVGHCKSHNASHPACPQCIEAKRAYAKANPPKGEAEPAAATPKQEVAAV